MTVLEVAAQRGRALVGGHAVGHDDGADVGWGAYAPGADLPVELVELLDEWARAAEAVARSGAGPRAGEAVRVSRTGRHLAARVSVALGRSVDYCDPVTGFRIPLRAVSAVTRVPEVTLPRRGRRGRGRASTVFGEPTPWATGLTLAALVAGLVLLLNLTLALPMVAGLGLVGLLIDLVVVAGLVPALWLNRRVPTWRWAVWGAFAGMGVAVLPLLVVAVRGVPAG
ncbi:DUF2537 domain-containing protein [Actinomycetospora sp. TBRC 11914]|uniref:DUF2537 domain-containing protein n=1 Tax=Actinomycetospora sp. TBRC 11914 TaxID=2729387 RepID=UPI00145FC125|nr:DUF2537 domain-containing protein [Actinomycetospora sp. TBRC 11914]NMO92470.1 DUF2537 domain-containing protein [Actinomycetospora sp. TBRC 11914]